MPRQPVFPITFAVTPRFDLFYALYTLTQSGRSPIESWKNHAVTRLPDDFLTTANRVAPVPLFWPLFADALQRVPGELTFDEISAAIRDMSARELATNILSEIFHDPMTVRAVIGGKKKLSQAIAGEHPEGGELLRQLGLLPYDAVSRPARTMATLVSRTETFRSQLLLVLEQFWKTLFQNEWSALQPVLQAECSRMREMDEELQFDDFARQLQVSVDFDVKSKEVRSRTGASVPFDRVDTCCIIPSAFNVRRWWARYQTRPGHFALYFPIMGKALAAATQTGAEHSTNVRALSAKSEREDTPRRHVSAESVFRALGDTTRYAIASVLARSPTTSSELARSLNVSKPTITHHIQALRSAGLVSETPAGGSVKLSLDREAIAAISDAAVEQLFSSSADLTLATTRKRPAAQPEKKG